jgi:hypothetical protein
MNSSWRRGHLVALLACILMLLSSCGTGPRYQAQQDDIVGTLQFAQAPIVNQSVPVDVVFQRNDQTVAVTTVALDLQMPGMVMGSNRPLADARTDGTHRVNVLFTMEGEWSIVVTGDSAQGPVRMVFERIIVSP